MLESWLERPEAELLVSWYRRKADNESLMPLGTRSVQRLRSKLKDLKGIDMLSNTRVCGAVI